ncbi:TPA: cytoplasmic protein [Salmonella bongori]
MSPLFTINACKSFGCRNLGVPDSPDYVWPDHRLGYPALHCRACGSYPPLFNEDEFRRWASACLAQYAREYGHFCPQCYQHALIRYGHNPRGTQRLQCQHCKKVWTPKQPSQQITAPPEQICSVALIVPFQGSSASQQLYVIVSFDAIRGNILHISGNFTPLSAGKSLHYHWKGIAPPESENGDITHRIAFKERQFLQRSQFDEIQYGPAMLKRNAKGTMLRPVIAAHGHFRLLQNRFPAVTTHIIAHECFLRGAVITAWAERFRQRLASLWFVEEEINDEECRAAWQLLGKTWQGWWQNQWQLWGQGNNRKMVCSLTGSHLEQGVAINMAASRRFIAWLCQQPEFRQSAHYSAGHVTQILYLLAEKYNSHGISFNSMM